MFILKSLKVVIISVLVSTLVTISVSFAETEYKVKSTDSLSRIVDKFYKDTKLTRSQIYIGILAENPNAFSRGNINYLKNSQRLLLPLQSELLLMEVKDAENLVSEHNDYARQGKKKSISPPFKDYSPKNSTLESDNVSVLAEKQQTTSQKLEKLHSETEELRIRLEKLVADKEAMDSELNQLNSLLDSE